MQKIKKVVFIIIFILSLTQAGGVSAQESSASTSPTPAETTQKIKERIQRIVKEKSAEIKGVITQLSKKKRGFIGKVERVTAESLTISNVHGIVIIPIDKNVTLLKKSQKISVDKVAVGDWLVVMGLVVDDTFEPKRILVSSETVRPRTHLVNIGTIVAQNSKKITILSRKNETLELAITKKTDFQDLTGESVSSSKFKKDFQVIVVGYENENGKTATVIRSLVSLENIKDNE